MKRQFESFDFIIIILVVIISIFGIVVIGSATHLKINGFSDKYKLQQIWFALGLVLMVLAMLIDYHFITQFYIVIYVVNIILLIAAFFLDRSEATGVTRWIRIGSFGIQPSEFAKIFIILFLAKFIDKKSEKINNVYVLLSILALTGLPFILIVKQPSLSAALVIVMITLTAIFVAKVDYKYIMVTLIVSIPIAILSYIDLLRKTPIFIDKILGDYQMERITMFLRPDEANEDKMRQTLQSIKAIGSGQFSGKGLYNGTLNRLNYLSESHNDFIFSVIGEEFGFLGCALVLLVMFLIIIMCILVAQRAVDLQGKLIASSVAFMLAFQSFVNVGVATGLLPNTGMPFPFLSYGGSSMWISMISIGLVLNVGMSKTKSFFET